MDGIIVINKPLGYTSRDIVNIVAKELNTRKIGHTGTLDPKASGVMVLCIGKALKICELLTNYDKEYVAKVILGIETDTLDMDKNATLIREVKARATKEDVIKAINSFKGKYMQEVPIYSSVKVNGRKLYEYARSNTSVEIPKKEVEIKDISLNGDLVSKDDKVFFEIRTVVSKGTYIRSLVRDIGMKLDLPAVMDELTRTRQGNFSIKDANTMDDIKKHHFKLYKITDVLKDIPIIKVNDKIAFKVKNGVYLDNLFDYDMTFIMDNNDTLLALYKRENDICMPFKMFI